MQPILIEPEATIHLIGICGTGMGALAGLLKAKGFKVRGSDAHAYPPMSTELERLGIEIMDGYDASHLDDRPDLVVVGNVCRRDHVEAAAARDLGLLYASMPRVAHDLFLRHKRSIVMAGTHGKTTTTALTAFLLHTVGRDPSMLLGGVSADFGGGYLLGNGPDFVIEGDEYDSAYFEKRPKFLSYAPKSAVITSVEYDHIDIYPSFAAYKDAFSQLVSSVEAPGPIALYAGDRTALDIAEGASCRVITYGVEGDPLAAEPNWRAVPKGTHRFDLMIDEQYAATLDSPLKGRHNLRNVLAALIMCHVTSKVPIADLAAALPGFQGVARRQEVIGRPNGITVYDDFAHHPTAVSETLKALSAAHPNGRLLVAFEPRSATACRRLHQEAYSEAFDASDRALIAPVGRCLPPGEALDTALLAVSLRARGIDATAPSSIEEVEKQIVAWARPGDVVALLSNGGFGGIRASLLSALAGPA